MATGPMPIRGTGDFLDHGPVDHPAPDNTTDRLTASKKPAQGFTHAYPCTHGKDSEVAGGRLGATGSWADVLLKLRSTLFCHSFSDSPVRWSREKETNESEVKMLVQAPPSWPPIVLGQFVSIQIVDKSSNKAQYDGWDCTTFCERTETFHC